MRRFVWLILVLTVASIASWAQGEAPKVPAKVVAGTSFTVATSGSGKATLYLLGPGHVAKRDINLGAEVQILGEDVAVSGEYQIITCESSGCAKASLQVVPADARKLTFLLHPSRVPVSAPKAVNGTALVSDRFHNTVLTPTKVEFQLSLAGKPLASRTIATVRGIASFEMNAGPKQGALEVMARLGDATEPRVIQQVAAEACGLRMNATQEASGVILQTDPIRDCSGNPLPDGTIVSFTKIDGVGKSTVDTPIKKEKATARFQVSGPARISVACGVVSGNEISLGGRP
jgi:hypothetical protein